MNNLGENALRIAELLDYDEWRLNNIQDVLICRYTAYDYLMPIVFECNAGILFGITIRPDDIVLHEYSKEKYYYDCKYTKEPEFIEAIQLACIKYLERKND